MKFITTQNTLLIPTNSTQNDSATKIRKTLFLALTCHLVSDREVALVKLYFFLNSNYTNSLKYFCKFFVGSRLALMEMKAIFYYLLLNFSFKANAKTDIPIKFKKQPFSVKTENGINIELKPRKK